jgi:hypothetical protein
VAGLWPAVASGWTDLEARAAMQEAALAEDRAYLQKIERLVRVPPRAAGKLFAVPAGALPAPVSERLLMPFNRTQITKCSPPRADLLPGKAVLLPSQAGSPTASHQPWIAGGRSLTLPFRDADFPLQGCSSSVLRAARLGAVLNTHQVRDRRRHRDTQLVQRLARVRERHTELAHLLLRVMGKVAALEGMATRQRDLMGGGGGAGWYAGGGRCPPTRNPPCHTVGYTGRETARETRWETQGERRRGRHSGRHSERDGEEVTVGDTGRETARETQWETQ